MYLADDPTPCGIFLLGTGPVRLSRTTPPDSTLSLVNPIKFAESDRTHRILNVISIEKGDNGLNKVRVKSWTIFRWTLTIMCCVWVILSLAFLYITIGQDASLAHGAVLSRLRDRVKFLSEQLGSRHPVPNLAQ